MKFEIKNRRTDEIMFSVEADDLKSAIVAAIYAKVNLREANLRGADLRGANLREANLCGANLRGADLRGANLREANLCGANLCGADLYGADLCGANLREANLCGANLCGANLCGANLREANLREANLHGADLREANLYEADLREANLYGADLRGAGGLEKFPFSISAHKDYLQTTIDGKLAIGCHVYSFEEWERHADKIGAAEKYSPLDVEIYKLHIAHLHRVSQLLWNAKKE